ncbi:tyrosine-type recombinase/integrase [Acetobacter malorum]|uniref:tyrosine-type recombinase/integrase n=1 Tax=Acetobacter malorum TaxID=178901 RepID=UPI0039EB269C
MQTVKLKYLKIYRDNRGKTRYYLRRAGFETIPLPDASDPEFMVAYGEALKKTTLARTAEPPAPSNIGKGNIKAGTLEALIVSWQMSGDYLALKDSTKAVYNRLLNRIRADKIGQGPFADMQPEHVRVVIAALGDAPTTRSRIRRLLSQLMDYAIDKGWRQDNPVASVKIKRRKSEGIHPWTDPEIEQYLAQWPPGTPQRLALSLMLYTGQRRSDVVRMGPFDVHEGMIYVRQEKTNECLWIPIHTELHKELKLWHGKGQTYLSRTSDGKPYTANGFYNVFKDWCALARLPMRCSPHGLRKAAGRRLAEAGCTPHQIAAILGHKTLSETMRYTQSARQKTLAQQAIGKYNKLSSTK